MRNVINAFFKDFDDFECEPFGNGHINDTFLLTIVRGEMREKFILQQLNTTVFSRAENIAHNALLVAKHLSASTYRYHIPTPFLTTEGNIFFIENNSHWRVNRYFSDSYAPEKCQNLQQAAAAATAFGHFFKTLTTLETSSVKEIIPDFHNATLRWQQFEDALRATTLSRVASAKYLIEFLDINYSIIEDYELIIKQLPLRITHNDTKITNILFDKNNHQPLAIIDWDTIQVGTVLSDFGDMVRTFCNNADEDEIDEDKIFFLHDFYAALEKNFVAETVDILTETEKNSLLFAAQITIYVQALRFLTDYLNGDVYYKIKYAEHNFFRAKNQILLLKSLLQ
jgi:aminoglycoside phosphotransferase (APT) family kinase protein